MVLCHREIGENIFFLNGMEVFMKRALKFLVILGLILSLSACDALFTFNAFSSLEKMSVLPSEKDAATMTTEEYVLKAESPTFFEALSDPANVEIKTAVLTNLETTFMDPATPPAEVQQAALVYAAVQLETSGAAEVVNNAVSLISDLGSLTSLESAPDLGVALSGLVSQLIPADVLSDPVALNTMIDALIAANDAYVAYGNVLLSDPSAPVPDNVNPGEIAMNALICAAISAIDVPVGTNLGDVLTDLLNGEPLTVTLGFTLPDLSATSYLGLMLGDAGIDLGAMPL